MYSVVFRFIVICGFVLFCSIYSPAFSHKKIAQHGTWTVAEVPKNAVYVLASPQRSQGKYSKRGRVYAMATFWHKGEASIHFEQGYTVKKGVPITVSILDKHKKIIKKYKFLPHKEELWAPANLDKDVMAWMKKGYYMIVDAISSRGTKTKDTYNLSGISKSLQVAARKQTKKPYAKKTIKAKTVQPQKKKASPKKSMPSKNKAKKVVSSKKEIVKNTKKPTPTKVISQQKKSGKKVLVVNKPAK